jgi:hypothetical protein
MEGSLLRHALEEVREGLRCDYTGIGEVFELLGFVLDVVPAMAGVRRTYGFDGANGAVHHSGVHLFEWRHVE